MLTLAFVADKTSLLSEILLEATATMPALGDGATTVRRDLTLAVVAPVRQAQACLIEQTLARCGAEIS
jgi:hypothetical protein